jgi:hypothetical protein
MLDISSIRMTFPNTQSDAETYAIFEAFKEQHPALLDDWREIERRGVKDGEMTLQPIQALLRTFVMERTECVQPSASISLFMEFRMLLLAEIRGCTISELKASFRLAPQSD